MQHIEAATLLRSPARQDHHNHFCGHHCDVADMRSVVHIRSRRGESIEGHTRWRGHPTAPACVGSRAAARTACTGETAPRYACTGCFVPRRCLRPAVLLSSWLHEEEGYSADLMSCPCPSQGQLLLLLHVECADANTPRSGTGLRCALRHNTGRMHSPYADT